MTWEEIVWALVATVASFSISLIAIVVPLVRLPPSYFLDSHSRQFWANRHKVIRWTGLILKNGLGLFLILLGGILSIPGIPGQGLLTVLVGVMLLDFSGKRRVERAILRRPRIRSLVNRLRQRFGKPPFQLEEDHVVDDIQQDT